MAFPLLESFYRNTSDPRSPHSWNMEGEEFFLSQENTLKTKKEKSNNVETAKDFFLKNKRNEKDWYKQILKYFMELRLHKLLSV